MTTDNDVLLVYCTCPDAPTASRLARELVARRHAACVSQVPGLLSTYRWQGQLTQDEEILLTIKTTAQHYPLLEQALLELHPYELPEILAVPVRAGLSGYLEWVAKEVTSL